ITLGEELEAQRCIEKSPRLPHALSLPWRRAPVYPLMSKINIQALLVVMLVVAAFLAGVRFERERQRRENKAGRLPAYWLSMGGYDILVEDGRQTATKQPPALVEIPAGDGQPARLIAPIHGR
ncbi:MAG TPA: hypothetical protein VG125_28430, partial [Pirellulales bacterium]|nr:hypothetical protein [Pirellulales bacterium]